MTKETIFEQLKNAFSSSLKVDEYLRHPTFHTLVALLLKNSCLKREGDSNDDSSIISNMLRTAQSMGSRLRNAAHAFLF